MASGSNQSKTGFLEKRVANPEPKCQLCEDVSFLAVAYCFVCDLLYCENCWKYHQGIPPTRVHNSITLDNAQNMSRDELKQVQDSASTKKECAVVVTPQEAMAKSESIAAAYVGFTKDIDKLQQVMIESEEMEETIKQRKKIVDEEIDSAFGKVCLELDKRKKVLLTKNSHTPVTKRKRLSLQCKELSQLKKAMEVVKS